MVWGNFWLQSKFWTIQAIGSLCSSAKSDCFLDHDSFYFIFVIHNIDLLPLRAFIGPTSRLSTPITLANARLDIWILLSLWSCSDYYCRCWCRSVSRLKDWWSINWCGTQLNSLFTLQLVLDAWKVEIYFVVFRSSWPCYKLHQWEHVIKDHVLLDESILNRWYTLPLVLLS